ncbi:hypothetical protein BDV98DRAFT_572638 [Pterulicium gracile]|uniref:MaoC-like domain-containing protein n=1 Tax=Pterulicium gracile TaxID=1884261 RepID=A0A5C3Q9G2_9AGAR|nr:hypothetical protein BDV98DRAFT_572638 [Pterula gracilis]
MRSRDGRESVSLNGFEGDNPTIFVNQRMEFTQPKGVTPKAISVVEERRHAYLLPSKPDSGKKRVAKPVKDIPTQVDFELRYTPSAITLFRFSALIFNAHYIHLDRSYAQEVAGYPDLLVHGVLSALKLLEAFTTLNPELSLKSFEYRAHNPMIVDRCDHLGV